MEAREIEGTAAAPQFQRQLGFVDIFGLAFCYISPVVGVYLVFQYGWDNAGPALIVPYPFVALGQVLVALVFAELAIAVPEAGSLYAWGRELVGPRYGWLVGWIYGWSLMLGMAVIDYGSVDFWRPLLGIHPGHELWINVSIMIAVLVLHSSLSLTSPKWTAIFTSIGMVAEILGSVVVAVLLVVRTPVLSPDLVAPRFDAHTLRGMLPASLTAVWVFFGFEGAAALSEESNDARQVPRALVGSLVVSVPVTIALVVALVLAANGLGPLSDNAVETILRARLGDAGLRVVDLVVVLAFLSCATAAQTAGGRLLHAYGRDGVLRGSSYLRRVTASTRVPGYAVLATGVIAAFAIALCLALGGPVKSLLTNYSVIGIYISFQMVVGAWVLRHWSSGVSRLKLLLAVAALVYGCSMIVNLAWPWPETGFYPLESAAIIVGVGVALTVWHRVRAEV